MNVNINVNDQSGVANTRVEESSENTSIYSDAGPSMAATGISEAFGDDLESSAEMTSSDVEMSSVVVEDFDIGGPPEWLAKSIANSLDDEEFVADETVTDDINDGGDGPSE